LYAKAAKQLLQCAVAGAGNIRALALPVAATRGGIVRAEKSTLLAAALASCAIAPVAWSQTTADCGNLANLKLPDTTSLAAVVVAAGQFTPPQVPAPPPESAQEAKDAATAKAAQDALLKTLPAFCRVTGVIKPAVRFEVWLPMQDWNGKFEGTGNGGYNGAITYPALAAGVLKHYATSNTDMGHVATTPDPGAWALHHPELVVDQGYRAQHVTAVEAKVIVAAFYSKKASRSYFVGCSSGGWQALTEAHRYPHDYDGIIAGAPASEVVHLHAGQLWGYIAAQKLDPEKIPLISAAVIAKCDAKDGVKDGVISDPPSCDFKPAELACKSGQDPKSCLTPAEVTALGQMYAGAHYASVARSTRGGRAAWSSHWRRPAAPASRRWAPAPTATWCSIIHSGISTPSTTTTT
jgi:feruloyl esterase